MQNPVEPPVPADALVDATDAVLDGDLLEALWTAWREGGTVAARALSHAVGRRHMAELQQRAAELGERIVGWKIAHLPISPDEKLACAAPVLSGALGTYRDAAPIRPKLEVEHVARIEQIDANGRPTRVTWHVGLEVIDNHAEDGFVSPGWATADWGLNAAATCGDPCPAPAPGTSATVEIVIADGEPLTFSGPVIDPDLAFDALARDAAAIARPCLPGDLVWTGSLIVPIELAGQPEVDALVHGAGRAHLPRGRHPR